MTERNALILALGLMTCAPSFAQSSSTTASDFPNKQVTFVVPFPPAGGADTLARILASHLSTVWKQQVIVENRPGASGHIGAAYVAKAPPDGYTLMMSSTASLTKENAHQFAPVALVSAAPYVVTVSPKLNVKTMRELVSKAKAEPGKLSFGSSGDGSASHLTVELFKQATGVNMLHVPYKGTGQAVTDLLGGTIDLMFAPGQTVSPHVKAGKLLALAVTSAERSKSNPELPTIAEAGTPNYAAVGWFGLLAPAATPRAVIQKLNQDINKALADPQVEKTILAAGAEPAKLSADQFGKFTQDELNKWAQLEVAMASAKPK